MPDPIHIVTSLRGISGAESHSSTLSRLLQKHGADARLWSDRSSPYVKHYGGQAINAFAKQFPRGGTLVLVGTYLSLDPWLDHVKPSRLILVCINSDADMLYGMLSRLKRPGLPDVEMVYVSERLCDTMRIPGRVCPELMDLETFAPATEPAGSDKGPIRIGRLSRDDPSKHHAEDPSLYKLLAWEGLELAIMGGTCLDAAMGSTANISLLPAGALPAPDFLRSLDIFFYRTGEWQEPSGRVVMEALSCGLPVVAHVSGGYTDWIQHGKNGFLFQHQEEAHLHLRHLAEDSALRRAMGIEARASALKLAGASAAAEYFAWLLN
ncbi:MAG: glycosyltransferase [Rhodocyclaceae bacterium]|nr:glycosyltransferase [Rhodocyclaceae bacterium]